MPAVLAGATFQIDAGIAHVIPADASPAETGPDFRQMMPIGAHGFCPALWKKDIFFMINGVGKY